MQGAVPGADLATMNASIEALLDRQGERLIFAHPSWLQTWIAEFGTHCEPVVLTCSNGDLAGFAPLMRADDRITFIGDASICDFMDVVVDPDHADAAYDSLWSQLCEQEWGEIELWGLMESSPTRERIKNYAAANGYGVEETPEAVSPRLDLPGTWDEYLATLGKKDRHELRRKIRRLYESGASVDFEVLTSQQDVAAAMTDFLALHTQSRQDKTDFMTSEMESFFRRMASTLAAENLIRLFMLRVNGKPAASVLCFDAGSYLYMYNSGYDPGLSSLSVGLVSKALVLQWAIENGMSGLDFLRGDEPYKYDLGAKDQQIYTLHLTREAGS